jgi:hypothetical protein
MAVRAISRLSTTPNRVDAGIGPPPAGVDLSRAHERNRGARNDQRRATNRYLKRIHYGNRVPLLDNAGHRPRALRAGVRRRGVCGTSRAPGPSGGICVRRGCGAAFRGITCCWLTASTPGE